MIELDSTSFNESSIFDVTIAANNTSNNKHNSQCLTFSFVVTGTDEEVGLITYLGSFAFLVGIIVIIAFFLSEPKEFEDKFWKKA